MLQCKTTVGSNDGRGEKKTKKKYQTANFHQSFELVRLIEEENFTIKKAALQTGLNYSTAKNFLKKFKSANFLKAASQLMEHSKAIDSLLGKTWDTAGQRVEDKV